MTRRIAVIGGGLAGLAAAVRLVEAGADVELFEARGRLGGRAGSFHDRDSAAWVDHCQHVGMGCCQRLLALCETIGRPDFFRRDPLLRFIDPAGRVFPFRGRRGWPAPLHLGPAFLGLGFLGWRDRWSIGRTLLALARLPDSPELDEQSIADWLRRRGASDAALRRFWSVVLVSALSESLEGASLAAARKVFVDGFLSAADAYELLIPAFPLDELSESIGKWLEARGARVHRGVAVQRVAGTAHAVTGVVVAQADREELFRPFPAVVVATPWHRLPALAASADFAPRLALPLEQVERLQPAAITSVHLWFDRPVMPWPHAVLVDRLSHWIFHHGNATMNAESAEEAEEADGTRRAHGVVGTGRADRAVGTGRADGVGKADGIGRAVGTGRADRAVGTGRADGVGKADGIGRAVGTGRADGDRRAEAASALEAATKTGHLRTEQTSYYYQVVISATHRETPRTNDEWVNAVLADLRAVLPDAREARVERSRVVTQSRAVFRPSPGLGRHRPSAATPVSGLFLAGDWIDTGWPATMEGAIRGGEQSAAAALSLKPS